MEVATTTTEAHLSVIHQSLLQISATLGRMLTYGCVNATSSPDAVVPAKRSTVGLNPKIGAVERVDSSQQSGIVSTVNPGLVGAPPSSTMQRFGILKSGKHTPTTCSTGVLDDQLTHIGGLSLFLELDLDSANKVFEDDVFTTVGGISLFLDLTMDFEVLTCVGDCSIFLQPSMGDPTEVFDTPPTVDMDKVLDHGVGVPVKGCKLKRVQTHAETCVSQPTFCVISRSRKDAKAMQLATYRFLIKVPSWRRSGFSPGYYERPQLEIMPSGRRGGSVQVV